MNKRIVAGLLIGLAIMISTASPLQADTLSASVDTTHLNQRETLTLTLQYDGRSSDTPDTTDLEKDFAIQGRQKSTNLSFINGDASSTTTWQFQLLPKKTGKLLIPSFSINNNFSDAIAIDVDNKATSTSQTESRVYTETNIDKKQVYVQQQIIITWHLVSRAGPPEVRLDSPQINGATAQNLGNRTFTRSRNDGQGNEWVVEQRFAIYPQQSGTLTIPAVTFQVVVNEQRQHVSGFFMSVPTQLSLDTDEQKIDVLPAPQSENKEWLPATSLLISQHITGLNQRSQATVGTAFTRTIRMEGSGISGEQLPQPELQADTIKVYAEKPTFKNKATAQGNTGIREDKAAVIATQAGKLVLPAIHVPWYDTEASQWREATLPESIIEVLPNPATPATPPHINNETSNTPATNSQPTSNENNTPIPSQDSGIWKILVSVLLFILLLLSLYIFSEKKKKLKSNIQLNKKTDSKAELSAHASSEKTTKASENYLAEITQAANNNNPNLLYKALSQWASTPERKQLLNTTNNLLTIHMLEKHLYGNGTPPPQETLISLAANIAILETTSASTPSQKKTQLDDLY